jgi:hypothetical protein
VGNTAVTVENMSDAGNTKITDLLSVTSPAIPQGAHAMTQLDELPRRTPDCRHIDIRGRYSSYMLGAGCSSSSRV